MSRSGRVLGCYPGPHLSLLQPPSLFPTTLLYFYYCRVGSLFSTAHGACYFCFTVISHLFFSNNSNSHSELKYHCIFMGQLLSSNTWYTNDFIGHDLTISTFLITFDLLLFFVSFLFIFHFYWFVNSITLIGVLLVYAFCLVSPGTGFEVGAISTSLYYVSYVRKLRTLSKLVLMKYADWHSHIAACNISFHTHSHWAHSQTKVFSSWVGGSSL